MEIIYCYLKLLSKDWFTADIVFACFYIKKSAQFIFFSVNNYLFKVNKRNATKRCKICSKFTAKTPEGRQSFLLK